MGAVRPCSVDFMDGGATDVPILGPMELKIADYGLVDYRTFYGLKIGPLLAEIQPLLCRKVKFYTNLLKITSKNIFFNFFFNRPTDLKLFKSEKNIWFNNFILFFYFRPTDCIKKAREKSAIRKINRAWSKVLLAGNPKTLQVYNSGRTSTRRKPKFSPFSPLFYAHSPDRLSEWNQNSNLSLLHMFSKLSKFVLPSSMRIL